MTISDLIDSVDIEECVNIMLSLHRQHYNEPGYILNNTKITSNYQHIIKLISSPGKSKKLQTIKYNTITNHATGLVTYELTIEDRLFRDWFKANKSPYDTISAINIDAPKQLDNINILIELLYEISYYSFPKNVDN